MTRKMAKTTTNLPEGVIRELRRIVREAPPEKIRAYAKNHENLAGRDATAKPKVSSLRKSIAGKLTSDSEVDPDLRDLTRESGLNKRLLDMVAEPFLSRAIQPLLVLCGKDALIAAMLMDPRPSVRALAQDCIRNLYTSTSLPDDTTARHQLEEAVVPFLQLLRPWLEPEDDEEWDDEEWRDFEEETDSVDLHEEVDRLERELKKQQEEAKRETTRLNRKLRDLSGKHQKLNKELAAAQKRVKNEVAAREQAASALKEAEEQNRQRERRFETDVQERVDEQVNSLLNSWLRRPATVEREASAVRSMPPGSDVLARAATVLKRQAETDRHSGNRAVLKKRKQALEAALERVRRERQESLHPLPELEAVDRDLETEISRLSGLLGDAAESEDQLIQRLTARINQAETADDLLQAQETLAALADMDVFGPLQLQPLYRRYHRRMAMLYAAFTPTVKRAAPFRNDPAWQLRKALADDKPMVLALDGHNILHLLPDIFGATYENGVPRAEARDKLVRATVKLMEETTNCRAHVFFDSPRYSRETASRNVIVVFSGGAPEEQHRADNTVLDYMSYCCRNMSAMPRMVITDDMELRNKSRELGAMFMPVAQFGAFLQEVTD